MEKTAVEYLIEQLEFALPDIEWSNYRNETNKAKEMFEQQIIEAYLQGVNSDCMSHKDSVGYANKYYNQTFNN